MHETFIDLDELIIKCRDKSSKKFIQEAVACYRAGAFRSCIVATWNAVVFDFLHKLRELAIFGDAEASKQLENFEKLSFNSENKVKELWKFESSIPKLARDTFELISPLEQDDIERLFKDRSKCAHPSMISLEEPFEATAELARYHLRSAVIHLLQHPPVQGRAAKERILQEIKSEYFPVDLEKAINYFRSGPLARAKFTLIKDLVLGLTVSILTEDLPQQERDRQFSALNAISNIHSQDTGKILNDNLSRIILEKVTDDNWENVIIYLARVTAWESLSEPCQIKARVFIEKLEVSKKLSRRMIDIFNQAYNIDVLRKSVIDKLQEITLKDLVSIINSKDEEDQLFNNLINMLEDKCKNGNLDEILEAKAIYQSNGGSREKILDIFDKSITKKIDSISFDDFYEIPCYHWKSIPPELFLDILKNNIPQVVEKFINSDSFTNADNNAELLRKITQYLSLKQWEQILTAFWENAWIYNSHRCRDNLEQLFKASLELNQSIVQPYWLDFRKKIDKSQNIVYDPIKKLIDSSENVDDVSF